VFLVSNLWRARPNSAKGVPACVLGSLFDRSASDLQANLSAGTYRLPCPAMLDTVSQSSNFSQSVSGHGVCVPDRVLHTHRTRKPPS